MFKYLLMTLRWLSSLFFMSVPILCFQFQFRPFHIQLRHYRSNFIFHALPECVKTARKKKSFGVMGELAIVYIGCPVVFIEFMRYEYIKLLINLDMIARARIRHCVHIRKGSTSCTDLSLVEIINNILK